MPEEEGRDERAELIRWLGETTADPRGVAALLTILGLILVAVAISVHLLRLLHRESPRIAIPAPRWGGIEAIFALVAWYLLQGLLATAATAAFPRIPATELGGLLDSLVRHPSLAIAQIAAAGIGGLTVAGGILLLPTVWGQPLTAIGIGTGRLPRGLGQGLLVYACALPGLFAAIFVWMYALILVGFDPRPQMPVDLFRESIESGRWLPAIAVMVFGVGIAPLVEELVFRGMLHRTLSRRLGVPLAVAGSAIIFGAVHGNLLALLPVTLLGILLALELERTGNLWSCISLHAAFNAGQFALMILAPHVPPG